ncbi:hypothetical protein [Actinoplanes sp. N902-109]|uniref:hypothetical protein n=1 Tax=Actinoplanes sp. (strain N902-109) TaxID=649831 RepID=UPI0003295EAF|nr:hypothetical protein [Actinoplanes sp. N902-109]AGL15972.1 hypothetical protein L083_2462 [Actinoplanes sp. N902-109]
MTGIDDFVTLLNDDIGLCVDHADLRRSLDDVAGWDSLHLLTLLTLLERSTGRRMSLPDALAATSLQDIYELAAGA